MSDSRPGRRKQGKVIKIRDLERDPITRYLELVALDNNLKDGVSAAGQLVLDTARMAGQFLAPASMRKLQDDSKD